MAAAKESEREGKQGERKQRTPEEAEKVWVNGEVPALWSNSTQEF